MKKNIAVIFGGKSAEHDVSIITAHNPIIDTLEALDEYEIYPIYISKSGVWYCDKKFIDLSFFKQENFEQNLTEKMKIGLDLNNGLSIIFTTLLSVKKIKIDIVFPAMHGTYGEDGSLMGLLRMADTPFVGCDIFASTLAMDKATTKQVLKSENILTTSFVTFSKKGWQISKEGILNNISKLKYPLFVKPVHLGSSIGISKVKNVEELLHGIEVALFYDDKVLVEEGVENLIEVTLPIIGNDDLVFGGIERALNKTEFFDFQEKYLNQGGKKQGNTGVNNSYSEIPANIDQYFLDKVKELGEKTYKILGCEGIARIDFLINEKTRDVFVNEVNTLPGSLYQHNFKKIGVSNIKLIKSLLSFATERSNKKESTHFTFNSTILKNAGGKKLS